MGIGCGEIVPKIWLCCIAISYVGISDNYLPLFYHSCFFVNHWITIDANVEPWNHSLNCNGLVVKIIDANGWNVKNHWPFHRDKVAMVRSQKSKPITFCKLNIVIIIIITTKYNVQKCLQSEEGWRVCYQMEQILPQQDGNDRANHCVLDDDADGDDCALDDEDGNLVPWRGWGWQWWWWSNILSGTGLARLLARLLACCPFNRFLPHRERATHPAHQPSIQPPISIFHTIFEPDFLGVSFVVVPFCCPHTS